MEAILKIIAFGSFYFKEGINIFDLSVVIVSTGAAILDALNLFNNNGSVTSILRLFRIVRILRLIKKAKTLRVIFSTLIYSLSDFANISVLLLIVLFIYAIIAVNQFPYIQQGGEGITPQANYSSFGTAIFTLFKQTFGEDWHLIMADSVRAN